MGQQTGRVTVKIDGDTLRSKAGASMQKGGIKRPAESTDQGETIYKENVVPGVIKCTMVHMSDTDLDAISKFKGGTVQYITDTNVTYTMANAVCSDVGDLSNGEVEVTFSGDAVK